MSALSEIEFEGLTRERRLVSILDGFDRFQAYELMPRIGLSWRDESTKLTAFVAFLNVYLRARKILERHGLTIKRTDHGTPAAEYWIEHLRS
jgi:hypothetical protein